MEGKRVERKSVTFRKYEGWVKTYSHLPTPGPRTSSPPLPTTLSRPRKGHPSESSDPRIKTQTVNGRTPRSLGSRTRNQRNEPLVQGHWKKQVGESQRDVWESIVPPRGSLGHLVHLPVILAGPQNLTGVRVRCGSG